MTDRVRIGGEALDAVIRGYVREVDVWDMSGALGAVSARMVRPRPKATGAKWTTGTKKNERHEEDEEQANKRGRQRA